MSTQQSKPLSKEEKQEEKKYIACILTALGLIVGYVLVYFISRVICLGWPWEAVSLRSWLNNTSPTEFSYLYGWLIHGNLFWLVPIVTVIVAVIGKYRFSLSCFAGFVIGLVLGELFGELGPGDHCGWLIWWSILLFSVVMGVILEKGAKKGEPWLANWFALWCGVFLVGVVALVPLMRLLSA